MTSPDARQVVIVGGGVAGRTCALELKKRSPDTAILVIEECEEQPYAPCAFPYWVAGLMDTYETTPTREDLEGLGIDFLSPARAVLVDTREKRVLVEMGEGRIEVGYERLVLATGARPGKIKMDADGSVPVLGLWRPSHAVRIRDILGKTPKRVVVAGAGVLGCEIAGSLALAGHRVHLVEIKNEVLPGIAGPGVASLVREHLEGAGCRVFLSSRVVRAAGGVVSIEMESGSIEDVEADLVLAATGFLPNTELARKSGISVERGVLVNSRMQTSARDVYACGDCVQYRGVVSHLAPQAMAQARVVASNILGEREEWKPGAFPFIAKIGGLSVGGAGTVSEGNIGCTIEYKAGNHKGVLDVYATPDGFFAGGSVASPQYTGDLVNLLALAIDRGIRLEELEKMEYSYNPSLTDSIHPLVMAASVLSRRIRERERAR